MAVTTDEEEGSILVFVTAEDVVGAGDEGKGIVAGVEVSFDGGKRFHPSERHSINSFILKTEGAIAMLHSLERSKNKDSHPPTVEETAKGSKTIAKMETQVAALLESKKQSSNNNPYVWVYEWGTGLVPGEHHYDDPWKFRTENNNELDIKVRAIDDSCNMEAMHGRQWEERQQCW